MANTEHISLDLVATVGGRFTEAPIERLPDAQALRAWLDIHALAIEACGDADLEAARTLREALYDLVEAAATNRAPDPAALTTVNAHAAHPSVQPTMVWDKRNGFSLDRAPLSADQALNLIARDAIDLLTGPERDRLHQCEADTCGTVFVVSGGGKPRRWCSSSSCGNRERVRAHRATKR
ncbi:CGNR zinc finger domain-containing protein [Nocardia sp. CDC160]|uniref:CGNR zinc finger domain-containing protein n=1 Tax=Nocardia sp. CDC160 TaxID=3112166 RepID=UPI002DBAB8EB|nr:CGNR zinc finger domain-containing protein [Nocardia sp. CDC160]MEC3917987.1 CGNR zinc finger domain-containing protein [Nocardia sp. CDC160]